MPRFDEQRRQRAHPRARHPNQMNMHACSWASELLGNIGVGVDMVTGAPIMKAR